MNLIEQFRLWLLKPDLHPPLARIASSLSELLESEQLSDHGKMLLSIAMTNVSRLEDLLSAHDTRNVKDCNSPLQPQANSAPTTVSLLLAEADTDTQDFFREYLSGDYAIEYVNEGMKALEYAKESNPDIIIADALLPGLRGIDLCRRLKSAVETSHIPVILLSALNEKENIIFGLEAGASDYIVKPLDIDILRARIRNIILNREQLRSIVFSHDISFEETNYTNELDIRFLEKATSIIEKEISNPDFSINEFCSSLAMSRTSVYNKLKSLTNQAPNDFIRIIRLNHARNFLISGKYTVAEVSCRVGFTDPKYFSTSFKKQFGISPRQATKRPSK